MSKEFLDYYQDNLQYMHQLGSEFAREFPKLASRLDLRNMDSQDPFVERLLEGTAFLAARVEKKLDDGVPQMLEALLASTMPQILTPEPACCVLKMQMLNPALLAQNNVLPAESQFSVQPPGAKTSCIFTTLWDMQLISGKLNELKYLALDIGNYGIKADAGILFDIELNNAASKIPDELVLFLNMNSEYSAELQRQLQVDLEKVYVQNGENFEVCTDIDFVIPGIDKGSVSGGKIADNGRLHGIEVLRRFLKDPAIMRFLKIKNFDKLASFAQQGHIRFIVALKCRNSNFVHALNLNSVYLNCIPAINAFTKRTDRSTSGLRHEFPIIPDRTAPMDYEVMYVSAIHLFDANNRQTALLRNMYEDPESFSAELQHEYFSVHRSPRQVSQGVSKRSNYLGFDSFVSFSGAIMQSPNISDMQFSADVVCSNRDLPLLLKTDAVLASKTAQEVVSAVFAVPPSSPAAPVIYQGHKMDWEKVGYLTLHFSSMLWQSGTIPLKLLREMICLYSGWSRDELRTITEGIVELRSDPHFFRYSRKGCVFFEKGWYLRLVLDEQALAGVGTYLFACVLRELICGYAPLNTPVLLEFSTKQQGKITEWTI